MTRRLRGATQTDNPSLKTDEVAFFIITNFDSFKHRDKMIVFCKNFIVHAPLALFLFSFLGSL